jgi:serine/threonine protein kinase
MINGVYDGFISISSIIARAKFEHLLQNKSRERFAESLIMDWMLQCCLGVKYIHQHNIIHRDIKVLLVLRCVFDGSPNCFLWQFRRRMFSLHFTASLSSVISALQRISWLRVTSLRPSLGRLITCHQRFAMVRLRLLPIYLLFTMRCRQAIRSEE